MNNDVKVTQADRDLLEEIKETYWPMSSDDKALAAIANYRIRHQPQERERVMKVGNDTCPKCLAAHPVTFDCGQTINVRTASQPEREAVLEEAAREVLRLARNPGVAAGDNGRIGWGQALQRLEAALTTFAPVVSKDEALIRRIEYTLDPTASAAERTSRRAHLTNHDLRTILSRLEAAPAVSTDDLWNPPEHAWDGLARQLVMWLDMGDKTPRALFEHLERTGCEIPQWLRDEPELQHLDHVPSKGTRAVIIYRAILSNLQGEA